MQFTETKLSGAYIITLEEKADDRGFFARAWCQKEFEAHGLVPQMVQMNFSKNLRRATLRGMHYQVAPYAEVKVVRCIRGALYDVIVDLRPESSTYLEWIGVELSADNRRMLYVPQGFGHGFETLVDDTEALYQVSEFYTPEAERGARYNDPAFRIEWPLPVEVVSAKDASWADFSPVPKTVSTA